MSELTIESIVGNAVKEAWQGGQSAMREIVLMHVEHERRMLACGHGFSTELLDKIIAAVKAIPLTEVNKL